jgi:hypothetical protein
VSAVERGGRGWGENWRRKRALAPFNKGVQSVGEISAILQLLAMQGGGAVHRGGTYGQLTGEGPSLGTASVHHVTIEDHRHGQVVEVDIPEDRYGGAVQAKVL